MRKYDPRAFRVAVVILTVQYQCASEEDHPSEVRGRTNRQFAFINEQFGSLYAL